MLSIAVFSACSDKISYPLSLVTYTLVSRSGRKAPIATITPARLDGEKTNLSKLHVVLVQLLLHDLLQHLQCQRLGLGQSHLL